jgi:hypothetical protein
MGIAPRYAADVMIGPAVLESRDTGSATRLEGAERRDK